MSRKSATAACVICKWTAGDAYQFLIGLAVILSDALTEGPAPWLAAALLRQLTEFDAAPSRLSGSKPSTRPARSGHTGNAGKVGVTQNPAVRICRQLACGGMAAAACGVARRARVRPFERPGRSGLVPGFAAVAKPGPSIDPATRHRPA